ADDGPGYDALVEAVSDGRTPWDAKMDLLRRRQVIVERLDERYVALRYPLGKLAQSLIDLRRKAREKYGKGSGAEKGYKETANTAYGVISSRFLGVNNVVAANYITATARALAFAMQMALNGYQVITDGCNYRRDQVPARTFKECLARYGDYPINRVGFDGPFL